MLKSDAAAFLAGVKQVEGAAASAPTNLHVITGEVGTTSEDGKTTISLDGLVFSEEDSQEIEMDTLGGLEEGDVATVLLTGENGRGMTPLAIGAPGSIDRIKTIASNAAETADAAQEVAEAVNQHFFADDNGIHVTEATQEDWDTNHTGANVLINSIGQLFRDGMNNLLALLPAHYRTDEFTGDGTAVAFTLSVTPYEVTSVSVNGITLTDEDWSASGDVVTLTTAPADGDVVSVTYRTSSTSIGIFDGRGNQSSNVVAEFSEDGVTVGRASSLNSFFNSVGIYFRDGANNLLSLVAGKSYYRETNVTYDSTLRISLGYYPVSIISVTLDGVEIDGYEVHGRYVTITEEFSGTKACRIVYRASPTLNMFAGDGSSDLVAQLAANLVRLARGGFRIDITEGPSAAEWTGTMSLVQDTQHRGEMTLGVRSDRSSYITLQAVGTGGMSALVLGSNRSLDFSYLDEFLFSDGTVTTEQALVALQQPFAMFTGTNSTSTASSTGWQLTYFNVAYANSGNWQKYFTFSNGVITAVQNIRLEISGCMNWTDSIAGNRGFGVFYNSSTVASGTEYSEFQNFPNTVINRKSVWMSGLVLNLTAGMQCTIGRYQQQNAVYVNGNNYSRIELKVLGVY